LLKTIKENTASEIVEKKSKFIANLLYVQSVEEAEEKINIIRKKYYDARHNCFAYSIMTNDGIVNKSSDDGEPSGTAGAPMLNIITKNELVNVLVIVTRYFGGILLGTGGLVKAYSEATLHAIEKAELIIEERGYEVEITINYNDFEKFVYFCKQKNIQIIETQYDEKIKCKIEINKEEIDNILKQINNFNFKIVEYNIIKEKNIKKNINK
jgi:uncharacterized YigZ family protein